MKVVIISNELMDADILIPEIEFPAEPVKGDYIDVETFLEEDNLIKFNNHLSEVMKLNQGYVRDRSWRNQDGEVMLFIFLEFSNDIENEEN